MKKLLYACGFILALIGASLGDTSNASADVATIGDFNAQYKLSANGEGRSVLHTIETIEMNFPKPNTSRGLERAIPHENNGHSINLNIQSVTDQNDAPLEYNTATSGDTTLLRVGNANTYVLGKKTYRIAYTQQDVARYYKNTNKEEWYWDLNGTQWGVPTTLFTASILIDESIRGAISGPPACTVGLQSQSGAACSLTKSDDGSRYTLTAASLAPNETVSVAFGFKPGTFAEYKAGPIESFMKSIAVIRWAVSIGAVVAVIILGILYSRRHNRTEETKQFATEFIPAKDYSVTVAARVVATKGSVMVAQLVDLSVRRYISIVETKPKAFLRPAEYDLVINNEMTDLLDEEKEIVKDMFGLAQPKVGSSIELKSLKNNTSYALRLQDNDKKVKALVDGSYGLRKRDPQAARPFLIAAITFTIAGTVTLSWPGIIAAGFIWFYFITLKPLTDKGVELRRYMLGLERYVSSTEKDRLAFLQGPETAQKIGFTIDGSDTGKLIKLYERTLPYAILFGKEKEWGKRLGDMYQTVNEQPAWYVGQSAFSAAVFSSSLSSFSQAAASYSGSSSSSSSGGTGGGISAGGGGGGGGGGSW